MFSDTLMKTLSRTVKGLKTVEAWQLNLRPLDVIIFVASLIELSANAANRLL